MEIIIKILAFLFAIFILTLVHEYGHFLLARCFGIKVIRFSIGFGKALYKWQDKKNTEYVIAAIPLGGYVKLLDSREMEVKPKEKNLSFDHKPVWQRTLVILAGPATNIIFAILVMWLTLVIGIKTPKPIIGEVLPNSAAYFAGLRANDEITHIGNKQSSDWQQVTFNIFSYIGDKGQLVIKAKRPTLNNETPYSLDLNQWKLDAWQPDPLHDLGIIPYEPIIKPVIAEISKLSPAAQSGLQVNDKIISVDGKAYDDWKKVVEYIKAHPRQNLNFIVERQNNSLTKLVALKIKTGWKFGANWKEIGYIGVKSITADWPRETMIERNYSPITAIKPALTETYDFMAFNFVAIEKLISGKLSIHVLGGPIAIFQSSSSALQHGIMVYIGFLGLFSLMLAFVNLLPIPGLDGCYILLFIIEGITRKTLPVSAQLAIIRIGMVLIILIMLQAIINDLIRLFMH